MAEEANQTPVSTDPVVEKEEETKQVDGEYKLNSSWSFWYSTKPKAGEETFESKLKQLGTFDTLSGFYNIYSHLARPSEIPKDSNYALFRHELKPMWETFPNGGCWNLHITKNNDKLSHLWERLVLAAIGELFEEPAVVGVGVSKRSKEDVLSVWINSPQRNIRFTVGEHFKLVFNSPDIALPIEYKDHRSSMKDRSTYHNGKFYVVPSS